jgi:hypothetical protein
MGSTELKGDPSTTTRRVEEATQLHSFVDERDDVQLQRLGKKPVLKV